MEQYDVIIIGAGIGGLMAAYRLCDHQRVLVIERGNGIDKRICPLTHNMSKVCLRCKQCAIMEGVGGAGAFSDGKFNITTEYGGWLQDIVGDALAMSYINQVSETLSRFGATSKEYAPSDEFKKKCLEYDLHALQARVKHLGTDGNYRVMSALYQYLAERVTFILGTTVSDIEEDQHKVVCQSGQEFGYRDLIIAIGRTGSEWFGHQCAKMGVEVNNNQVDIGVRVELPRIVWEDISQRIYEPKIVYRTKAYGDITRTFCFNSGGEVVIENNDGILTVNGHANADPDKKTQNSNFSILSTTLFTQPFNKPIEYAKHICKLANMTAGGGVIVQRFGDLLRGQRTNEHRLYHSTVRPTLNAVAGDLSLCLPKRQMDNIIETLYALDKIAPGTANYDTLLYGIETKLYSIRPHFLNDRFLIRPHVYAIGDGAGVSRGLAQAGANGLLVADDILQAN